MPDLPSFSPNALQVLERRYLSKDENGKVRESPDQMFRRVSSNIAAVSERYGDRRNEEREFYNAMRSLEFLPNSPTLMNAGTNLQQLSACFVIPVLDSIESIYDAIKFGAVVQQTGGGVGFSFSRLRPEGDVVRSTGGVASGPVSFMRVFDAATNAIKQGGRRRGANMGVLRVDHPDIERFIAAKDDLSSLPNFNLSVAVTDDFMAKAVRDEDYDLINPRDGRKVRTISASYVLDRIAASAWRGGDPGTLFIDTVNRNNPTPQLGAFEATNPCGEVPLLPFEACNLGSVNLDRMTEDGRVDWDRLARTVDLGVRFLDNVIDANRYPLPQTAEVVRGNRKIGLGIMGFADLLVRLKITYGSPHSLELADRLIEFIRREAERASKAIAESRGSFPNIERSTITGPQRNATLLSIAPTGTISMIAGCSSGIEPYYAVSFVRNVLEGQHFVEILPLFLEAAREGGFLTDELLGKLSSSPSAQHLATIPEEVRRLFVTAHDVPPGAQVEMQAAFQRRVDNAVSKTINLPAGTPWQEIRQILVHTHRRGCKGITVYREGSKPGQVLTAIGDARSCQVCGRTLHGEEGAMQCDTCG
ncbi:MAG: adenosylcobalamin-dependent ribonucleoside-diphosphate reductase [Methanomassiliicoccus sp.]|nr:adenosylcobalamin-dependent ribonucleoside-diphosphate reductase [Methanomassiliicoccus sp.]